jgi:Zn-dependent M28 family amino/carboxypeptidase
MELPPDLAVDTACGAASPIALSRCVDAARIEADVEVMAVPRPPKSDGHADVRSHCRDRLSELGFQVQMQSYATGDNVIGIKPGFSKPKERVVVSAHYDDVKKCPGADDNASGVAATLEAARVLGTGRFDRTLVVACWDEGERGQLGSKAYARNARSFEGETVLAVVFEAVGYRDDRPDTQEIPDGFERVFPDQALAMLDNEYRADFLTIVADRKSMPFAKRVVDHASHFQLDTHILRLTERIKLEMDTLHRSDHVSFWDEEMAAILLTDTGPYRNPRVRCKKGIDGPDSLDYDFAANVTRAAVGAAAEALEVR